MGMTNRMLASETKLPQFDLQDALIVEGLSLVRTIARDYRRRMPRNVAFEDLVQDGVIGLIEARRSFDPKRNVRFATFARYRIEGAMLDGLRGLDWAPKKLRREIRKLRAAFSGLQATLGRDPSDIELAEALELDLGQLHELTSEAHGLSVLPQLEVSEDHGAHELDIIEATPSPAEGPFELYSRQETRERLSSALCRLSKKQQLVLSLRYAEDMKMSEIALILDLSVSSVSQLHSTALSHLRRALVRMWAPATP